jgi:hypothetical protein
MNGEQIVGFLKSNPISVACGALVLTLGAGLYLRSDKVPDAEKQLDAKASQGERIDANLKNGVGLHDQFTAISAARQQIESRLVHPDALANNLRFFYQLEAETGTKLIDLGQNVVPPAKPGAKSKNSYMFVGYRVSVRGDYVRLLDFLRRLESGQRFCRIVTASMVTAGTSDKERGNDLTLTMGLELLGVQ